jgi:hypothetical protein
MAKKETIKVISENSTFGFVGFLAYIGAVVYFLQGSNHAGDVIYAFLEALVWPAIVVYYVLQNLGA